MRLNRGVAVLFSALWMLLFPIQVSADSFGEESAARDMTSELSAYIGETDISDRLTDRSVGTKIQINEGDELVLSAKEAVSAFYLIFDRPPDPYTVFFGEQGVGDAKNQIAGGADGFLHETLVLSKGEESARFVFPFGAVLCEIYAYSEGSLPREVQQWHPPYEDCDMLLLPTHADDDQLWFGAAMADTVAKDRKVQVAYLTNHWGEPYRQHELLNGLWQSGVTAYPVLSEFPDYYSEGLAHAKTLYDTERMLAYQVELLRRFRPEVVIGHDMNGEYGHGVHCLNTDLLIQATDLSADPQYQLESGKQYEVFSLPKLYLHLYPENQLILDVDTPLDRLGGRTAFEVAQDGYACHSSQQQYWFKVFKSGSYDCRKFGLYRSEVGLDTGKNDFFENIASFSDEELPEPESSEPLTESVHSIPAVSAANDSPPPPTVIESISDEVNRKYELVSVLLIGLAAVTVLLAVAIFLKVIHRNTSVRRRKKRKMRYENRKR